MPDILGGIWGVAKDLFGLRAELQKVKRDQRDRVADYFRSLAELVEEATAQLRNDIYPHGSCAQLQGLAQRMPETLLGLLPAQEVEGYRDQLLRVHEIEMVFGELTSLSSAGRSKRLEVLDEAAGRFRALVAHLKVAVP